VTADGQDRGRKVDIELGADGANKLAKRALWYAKNGIPVFPLHSIRDGCCSCGSEACGTNAGKHPSTAHGFLDATIEAAVIKRWWTEQPHANIGTPTGQVSGFFVVDIDPRNGGSKTWARLIKKYEPIPHTAIQATGGGGTHILFRHIPGLRCSTLAPGIDIKGEGGYIVVSPSVHLRGTTYRWKGDTWWEDLAKPADAPRWLRRLLTRGKKATKKNAPTTAQGKWPQGERNVRLTSLAGKLQRIRLSKEELQAALLETNQQRCEPPLDEAEVKAIASSVARYATGGSSQKCSPNSSCFQLIDGSVCYVDPDPDTEPQKICGPLEVTAFTRNATGEFWGRLLNWTDAEGRVHTWAMPMSLLAGDGNEYRSRLLDGGLVISPGRKARELLTTYISTAQPKEWATCVSRVGWHGDVFVLPDETIGPTDGETIVFQSPYEAEHFFNVSGTAELWRTNVGRYCSGNSLLVLVVSCAFVGPLLSRVGAESAGMHLHSSSSKGKTTAQIVGASVYGGGPKTGFLQTWRSTVNGLEGVAASHHDCTLFLDELSQVHPKEAGEAAYLLGNSQGKMRMTRSGGVRKKLSWSLFYVSSGEMTLAEHAASANVRTRAGAEIRLLNVEADAGAGMGVFENIHGEESADAFSHQLQDAARRYYGAPIRAYLARLIQCSEGVEKVVQKFRAGFVKRQVPGGAEGEVSRAADRFALMAAAGELATRWNLTGWRKGEAIEAAVRWFKSWLAARGTSGSSDMEAAIRQLRRTLQADGFARFPLIQRNGAVHPDHPVRDQAGFRRCNPTTGACEYWVFTEVFKSELCLGYSPKAVAKELCARGFIRRTEPHTTIKVRLPGFKDPKRVYCIQETILRG